MHRTLVTLLVCLGLTVAWDNAWDQPLHKHCGAGQSFGRIRSIHNNHKEDRLYQFDCFRRAVTRVCYRTNYVNNWKGPMKFACRPQYVVTGVDSYHINSKEDRRFRFRCCKQAKQQKFCYYTPYLNYYDEAIDYTVPRDSSIRGFLSIHRSYEHDRRWKALICRN